MTGATALVATQKLSWNATDAVSHSRGRIGRLQQWAFLARLPPVHASAVLVGVRAQDPARCRAVDELADDAVSQTLGPFDR
jgi:hypothetical protein